MTINYIFLILNIKMFINKPPQLSVLSCFYVPWGRGGCVQTCIDSIWSAKISSKHAVRGVRYQAINNTECVLGGVALEKIFSPVSVCSETLTPPNRHKFQNRLMLGALVTTKEVRLLDVISDWKKGKPQLRIGTEDGRNKLHWMVWILTDFYGKTN
jgi:hypothetical protein